jgi:hypothetical protein
VDDSNARVKMHDGNDDLVQVEVDGVCKAHNEMEPGGPGGTANCVPACGSGLECGDGICRPHKP